MARMGGRKYFTRGVRCKNCPSTTMYTQCKNKYYTNQRRLFIIEFTRYILTFELFYYRKPNKVPIMLKQNEAYFDATVSRDCSFELHT